MLCYDVVVVVGDDVVDVVDAVVVDAVVVVLGLGLG
jgi:hypothetical protein